MKAADSLFCVCWGVRVFTVLKPWETPHFSACGLMLEGARSINTPFLDGLSFSLPSWSGTWHWKLMCANPWEASSSPGPSSQEWGQTDRIKRINSSLSHTWEGRDSAPGLTHPDGYFHFILWNRSLSFQIAGNSWASRRKAKGEISTFRLYV